MLTRPTIRFMLMAAAASVMLAGGLRAADDDTPKTGAAAPEAAAEATAAEEAAPAGEANPNRITRSGLTIDFQAGPVLGSNEETRDLMEADYGVIKFSITDAASGEPVRGLSPGAWIDLAETSDGKRSQELACKDRIGLYLKGSTGTIPLVDLNSYFIMVMNEDATISVVDPNVMIAGIGNMFYTQVILPRPGGDWVQTKDQTRLFVTMPRADALAVVDTEAFRLIDQVKTGAEPVRVALQNDERYVWVANNAKGKMGGVTVIDAHTYEVVKDIETGQGHHEIAFTGDDRYALVTNRSDGTVSVIDVGKLEKVKDIRVGQVTMSIGYSSLGKSFYVADGATGKIAVIDGESLEITTRIDAKPGLGPMTVSRDGRWVLVTNASADLLHVVDTSSNKVAHDLPVKGKPYQVSVTRAFAYVRALENERISLIELAKLEQPGTPPIVQVPIGAKKPAEASSISIADSIVEAAGEAGVIAVSPAEDTLSFYMEGMNAPMGTFKSHGHKPRAVIVTDRALNETEPGVYSAKTQIPTAGRYDVALVIDSPPILNCFSFEAKVNPAMKREFKPLGVEYEIEDRTVPADADFTMRFRLTDPETESPQTGLEDVRVLFYRAPGTDRTEVAAREVGDGLYEAVLPIRKAGAYYVYIESRSKNSPYGELPYLTLRAVAKPAGTGQTGG